MSADFLDTNILVYLFDRTDDRKREVAEALIVDAFEHGETEISHQVVQETLAVLTGKLGATPDDARRFLEGVLLPLWRRTPGPQLYRRGLELRARHKFGFYDALIVAGALEAGCTRLYSEDLQHGQQIDGLTIVNPFLA